MFKSEIPIHEALKHWDIPHEYFKTSEFTRVAFDNEEDEIWAVDFWKSATGVSFSEIDLMELPEPFSTLSFERFGELDALEKARRTVSELLIYQMMADYPKEVYIFRNDEESKVVMYSIALELFEIFESRLEKARVALLAVALAMLGEVGIDLARQVVQDDSLLRSMTDGAMN